MNKIKSLWRDLTRFERGLWITSVIVVSLAYLLAPNGNWMTLVTSVLGVTALIFVAKGYIVGQLLCVVFAILYGLISLHFRYYGEVITYLCMSAPIAVVSLISWLRHPYRQTAEVEVQRVSKKKILLLALVTVAVTVVFYFILKALHTANLFWSTVSVATSFFAASLTAMRSPYYAIAYTANDIVLIVLWITATIQDVAYLPMIFCFVMFMANDLYGFWHWCHMRDRQEKGSEQ